MDTASTHATTSTLSFQPPVKTLDFRFHGKGFEYFRIWIVNILLSVLTLGIYSAWAKVRNKQYFYGNTELDGASFTYDAQPIKILKGRMIALGFIALLSFISTVNPLLGILIPLAFIPMTPFFIQRSLLFNARYSSYRNVRFGFTGSFKDAMLVFATADSDRWYVGLRDANTVADLQFYSSTMVSSVMVIQDATGN